MVVDRDPEPGSNLTGSDKIFFLLRHGRFHVCQLARDLLSRCGISLCELWKISVSNLQKIKGIGQKRAVKI